MADPRIYLLSGTLPGTDGVGALYLRELCRTVAPESIRCFCATHGGIFHLSPDLNWLQVKEVDWRHDRAWRFGSGKLSSAAAIAEHLRVLTFEVPRLVRTAVDFGREFHPTLVWAIMDSPTLYRLGPAVAERLKVPLITTAWDPPSGVCSSLQHGRMVTGWSQAAFDAAIRASVRCAVVSENMLSDFAARYPRTKFLVMRHAPSIDDYLSEEVCDDGFSIGFSGSIYAQEEWRALVRALDLCDWTVAGRPASLHVFGRRCDVVSAKPANVVFYGWRSADDVRNQMARLSCGYVPYWFDPLYADSVRECFPTKLTTYLSSGLPILFHGPRDSSPATFVRQSGCGAVCDTLNPSQIVAVLDDLARRPREEMAAAGKASLERELNLDVFLQRFSEFIGCPASIAAVADA